MVTGQLGSLRHQRKDDWGDVVEVILAQREKSGSREGGERGLAVQELENSEAGSMQQGGRRAEQSSGRVGDEKKKARKQVLKCARGLSS